MIVTEKTSEFDKWIRRLKDIRAKSKILFRIQKLETDEHFGDCKSVGDGISEMRIMLKATEYILRKKIIKS